MPAPLIRTRIAVATIRQLLHYDKRTGLLTWRVRRGPTAKPGDEAGAIRSDGSITVMLAGKTWLAHRLVWYYVTGELPQGKLLFRDGDKQNLRWSNLIEARDVLSPNPANAYQRDLRKRRRVLIESGILQARR